MHQAPMIHRFLWLKAPLPTFQAGKARQVRHVSQVIRSVHALTTAICLSTLHIRVKCSAECNIHPFCLALLTMSLPPRQTFLWYSLHPIHVFAMHCMPCYTALSCSRRYKNCCVPPLSLHSASAQFNYYLTSLGMVLIVPSLQ